MITFNLNRLLTDKLLINNEERLDAAALFSNTKSNTYNE
jgi:hypothetical protein